MQGPLIDTLARQGVTRRTFKYCATLHLMALPPSDEPWRKPWRARRRKRPSVRSTLPFQECTGRTESITRSRLAFHRGADLRRHLSLPGNPHGGRRPPGRGSIAQGHEGV